MKTAIPFPALRDRVEIKLVGGGTATGECRGRCCAPGGVELCDVMLDGPDREIVVNVPAERIVRIVRERVAA